MQMVKKDGGEVFSHAAILINNNNAILGEPPLVTVARRVVSFFYYMHIRELERFRPFGPFVGAATRTNTSASSPNTEMPTTQIMCFPPEPDSLPRVGPI